MMAWLMLAALLARPQEAPFRTTTVEIVAMGETPGVGSGTIHVTRFILGRSEDGKVDAYYLTQGGDGVSIPMPGSICVLHHRTGVLEMVAGVQTSFQRGEIVSSFECDPPPSQDEMIRRNFNP